MHAKYTKETTEDANDLMDIGWQRLTYKFSAISVITYIFVHIRFS